MEKIRKRPPLSQQLLEKAGLLSNKTMRQKYKTTQSCRRCLFPLALGVSRMSSASLFAAVLAMRW